MSATDILRDALFGNPPSPTMKPSREGVLAAFTDLYGQAVTAMFAAAAGLTTVPNIAARDAFFAIPANQNKLVYVNNNNGSATDPLNGVYEYVGGVARLAEGFSQGLSSVVQPLVDEAEAAAVSAAASAASLPTGNGQNLWTDPFFKRLRAAYPTPAGVMSLNGLRRFSSGTVPTWDTADNEYGGRSIVISAMSDIHTWFSEAGVAVGDQMNEVVAVNIPSGTTWTIQPVIQNADFSSNIVVGTTVTVVGTGAKQIVPIAAVTNATNGATMRLRFTRTVGTGNCVIIAPSMFQGAQRRPISKLDLLTAVLDNTAATTAIPSMQAAVSTWQGQSVTTVDGSYISNTGVVTVGGATNRYVEVAIPAAVATSSGPAGAATPGAVRVTATMPGGTGYWLASYYSDPACTTFIGHQFQGPGGADVPFINQVLTLPSGTRGLRINTRTTVVTTIEFYAVLSDLAQRVVGVAGVGFSGKKAAALGDSITEMARWFPGVVSALGLASIYNNGGAGTAVSKPDVSGAALPSMCDDARINAIPSDSKVIFFMGGTNDHGQSRPIGAITNTGVTTFDNTTFIGALEQVAVKLLARFNAGQMIVWFAPIFLRNQSRVEGGLWTNPYYNLLGLGVEAYQDAVRTVAKKYGFPVVDLPARLGWNTQNASLFYDHEGTDGTTYIHPSAAVGGPRMAAVISDEMMRLNRTAALV